MPKNLPPIGGHVSTAGGVQNAVANAKRIGADAIQFFGASPQSWTAKRPAHEDVSAFRRAYTASGLKAAYLHAAYLVNLASSDDIFYMKSVKSLTDHLSIADALCINGLIFHLGSSKGMSRGEALDQEVLGMRKVLDAVPGPTELVMENSAGGGEKVGTTIEEIAYLFKKMNSPRVKVCLDTAHAFEAGMVTDYTPATVKELFDDFDAAIGMKHLAAIHANDSKTKAESHNDKHENIGQGFIGMKGFRALAADARLHTVPWLLEVPGFEDEGPDEKNIKLLRGCFQ